MLLASALDQNDPPSMLPNALQSQQQQLQQMQQQQQLTAHAPLPIAPPCTPPKGAAASAPGIRAANASAAGTPCANSFWVHRSCTTTATGVTAGVAATSVGATGFCC